MPKDFTWDELVSLLSFYGFKKLNGAGSGRKFVNSENRLFICHEPHPGNIVKGYILKDLKALIEELDQAEQKDPTDLEDGE